MVMYCGSVSTCPLYFGPIWIAIFPYRLAASKAGRERVRSAGWTGLSVAAAAAAVDDYPVLRGATLSRSPPPTQATRRLPKGERKALWCVRRRIPLSMLASMELWPHPQVRNPLRVRNLQRTIGSLALRRLTSPPVADTMSVCGRPERGNRTECSNTAGHMARRKA